MGWYYFSVEDEKNLTEICETTKDKYQTKTPLSSLFLRYSPTYQYRVVNII